MEQKQFGVLLLILGALGVILALGMDTSVSTDYGRVNNLGLMKDQQNYLLLSSLITVVGVALLLLGRSSEQGSAAGLRPCPACAESIKNQAVRCRFCGTDVQPVTSYEANNQAIDPDNPAQSLSRQDLENLADFYGIRRDGDEFVLNSNKFGSLADAVAAARRVNQPDVPLSG